VFLSSSRTTSFYQLANQVRTMMHDACNGIMALSILSDPIACMTTTMAKAESIFRFVERRPAIRD